MNSFNRRRRRIGISSQKPTSNISPAAKKLAEENNIDYSILTGTGKDGMITVNDVKKAIGNTTDEE